ncbi:propanediol utilization microcompartment protein PduB [Rhodobacter capsulatus]|jgi:microcompartment protein PduB|uniref:Propanediol utilization protein PduB n=1 Tax=Rhodobacter capsulatus (strain ATCC BAA-309 / NBRC 16581 / SB1003) TaxID=272942 RepID=D5AKU8_RHOCB|nr:propanediol utilization microcompartment protein PduB [Rhodobacter capsulatus]ADE85938.1 propanediol utilization protein PduB [Rhodobacter capsulatus SB 1003]ETD01044.1 propanediol utilization protein PduB [Rhodobacter capsulatus DE442]ETD75629.1 propanediol utilization protein PduB [Rhodobacter capsulatus R121]ETE53261.1 propanediol utilization protein PduB [Rhodobacter capsulatus Y262]MDS0927776.1 propanediol utilization microcompartment protein PduB [Rhodobacter capsulatus]
MKDDLVEKLMDEVMRKMGSTEAPAAAAAEKPAAKAAPKACNLTEFVGTAIGHTVGLVIANVDPLLHEKMNIDRKYRSIGIVGARTGAGPHIFAADEAVKATNSEVVLIELPRDTEGGGGHGSLILFGAEDVSDARRAVEVTLSELNRTFGDVYGTPAGHLEFQYTARASHALHKAFGAPLGQAFGITVGAPAAIGVLMADTAAKAATVVPVGYASPGNGGTSHSNEVIFMFTGDSGAVRQAIIAAREVGKQVLSTLDGAEIVSSTKPYI